MSNQEIIRAARILMDRQDWVVSLGETSPKDSDSWSCIGDHAYIATLGEKEYVVFMTVGRDDENAWFPLQAVREEMGE